MRVPGILTHIYQCIMFKSEQVFQKRFYRETLLIYYLLSCVCFCPVKLKKKINSFTYRYGMQCLLIYMYIAETNFSEFETSFHVLNRGRTREVYSRDVRGTIQNWTTISDSARVSRCLQQYHKTCLYIHPYHSGQVGIVH